MQAQEKESPGASVATERWGVFELTLPGPASGNPFVDVQLTATFEHGDVKREVSGFYDGDGIYRVRFMPDMIGDWNYATRSNVPQLNGNRGQIKVTAESENNHGPVRVHNTFHFAYADGTPFKPLGTTCYA
ncbi:MAG TPA: DUF5060 domain-containing protein, partial [Lacipirellulaceae bacterium]